MLPRPQPAHAKLGGGKPLDAASSHRHEKHEQGWGNAATIALAVVLAFFFGYSFTMVPLLRAGMALRAGIKVALAADLQSRQASGATGPDRSSAIPFLRSGRFPRSPNC